MDFDKEPPVEVSRYREMQKAFPGVDSFYRLVLSQLETQLPEGGHIFVVGAGGGREVEALCNSDLPFAVTGVDPSEDMLGIAQWYAHQSTRPDGVQLIRGTTADVDPPKGGFDAATSLLVMHFLPDNEGENGKRAYLRAIRERLKPGALLIHADVSFGRSEEFESIKPTFLRHAVLAGFDEEAIKAGPEMIAKLPIISPARTELLLDECGFRRPQILFQSLWYRAWIAFAE